MLKKLKRLFSKLKGKKRIEVQPEEVLVSYEVKRRIIDNYRQASNIKVFIETGTFLGDTVEYFKSKFNKLYSVELSEDLAARAQQRFKDDENISIIQGDSGKIFETLIPSLNEPALFWLDGHYSSEFFHNGEYIVTAKADKNTPVEKELDILLNSQYKNTILIDDARLFTGALDYPTLEFVAQKVSCFPYVMAVNNDIIHITPNSL